MGNYKPLDDTITAIEFALKNKNFDLVNIFANRLVTDSIFLSNSFYNLFGIFIKEIAQNISLFDLSNDILEQISKPLLLFLNNFNDLTENSTQNDIENRKILLWTNYKNAYENLIILQSIKEEEHYEKNIDYSEKAIKFLLDLCINEFKNFSQKKRPLLIGIQSEMDRLFKIFGFEIKHLVLKTLISMHNRIFDYEIYLYSQGPDLELKIENSGFQNYLQNLLDLFKLYLENPKDLIEKSEEYLFEVAQKWRQYYLIYLDTVPHFIQVKRPSKEQYVIPEEAKNKLKRIVSKSISGKGEEK